MGTRFNFNNLLLARESRGITQKKMAEAIDGLNQGNLSKMEKGLLPVPEKLIGKIADYLDFPVSFFYKESQDRGLNTFFYRKRVTIPTRSIMQMEAKFDLIRMAVDELLDSVEIPDFSIPSIPVSDDITPEAIAQRIRLYLRLPKGPIDKLVSRLEKHGVIIIFIQDVPEKFFGVTMFTNKSQPILFVNNALSNDVKRFTIGHELGHLVMHLRENVYSKQEKELDKEADIFSSEFNMPQTECRKDLIHLRYSDLPSIKMYWKISKAAICYKAKTIGILGDSQYKYFMMQLSSSGQRKKEHEYIDLDKPTLLHRIIKVHQEDLEYNENQLTDLTGLSKRDMECLLPYNDDIGRSNLHIIRNWM